MRTRLLTTTAAIVLSAGVALSQSLTDQIVADLRADGYTAIEIKQGRTQLKVEATDGSTKIETVYDIATGAILKREVGPLGLERISPGVDIDRRNRDFVRVRNRAPGGGSVGGLSDPMTQGAIDDLVAQGFTAFEVKEGPTQLKIEATDGTTKIEIVIDRATGEVIKREVGALGAERISSGIDFSVRNRDFVRDRRRGDDDEDDEFDDEEDDEFDDEEDDDEEDDDEEDDDEEDDEDNSGSGSSNSGSGSSNSGSGNSN